MSPSRRTPPVPAVLRLVQVLVHARVRVTGEELYREVADLTGAAPGVEVLVSGCGDGVTTEWLATRTGASVTGVDPDAGRIECAERRARSGEHAASLTYTHAPLDDLPHETAVFDVAIGEPGLAASRDPGRCVAELVRVTKPMGSVVLLQPTWTSESAEATRALLAERLGLRPQLVMAWKQMMRDASVVDLQVQDWTTGRGASRRSGRMPAIAPTLTWQQKLSQVGRRWRGGERGRELSGGHGSDGRDVVASESDLIRELARERALGFLLIKGVKWPHGTNG
ncbi:MAG: hypothetical protein NVS1B4_10510 [Gemmatimonadaceae bacterium]